MPHRQFPNPDRELTCVKLEWGDVSKQNSTLYLEIGFKQQDAVVDIFKQKNPLSKIETKQDLANHPRMVKIQD